MSLSPPFSPERLYIVPLGGLGEIGKNMTAFLYGEEMIVVDAGVMFPKEDMLGIDFILPDFQFLLQHRGKLKGIFLTHGHEDHIGALPYILPKVPDVPVYGTKLTLALVKGRLQEFSPANKAKLCEIKPGSPVGFHRFRVDSYSNVHSIHEGVGFILDTPVGKVVHSGDFKFDPTPVSGMATDFRTLSTLGEEGVLVLLSDSTYAERPGYSLSEKIVGRSLDQIFAKASGRIILATFASSFPRIQQVIQAAEKREKKICFIGRRMQENVRIAREIGELYVMEGITVAEDELTQVPDSKLVILTTGSQGEPLSALSLMAGKGHKSVEITSGDTVIISATPIPGNEGLVFRTINRLYRLGAEVIYTLTTRQDESPQSQLKVHVQGHASQEELKFFINLLKPKFFIPIHGEYRHLVQHACLAREVGMADENVVTAVDGDVIAVSKEEIKIEGRHPIASILVRGYGIGEISKGIMKERRALGEDGILVIGIVLKRESGELAGEPELTTKGFISSDSGRQVLEDVRSIVCGFLRNGATKKAADPEVLKGNLKGELNKFFGETMGRKPVIIPVIHWVA